MTHGGYRPRAASSRPGITEPPTAPPGAGAGSPRVQPVRAARVVGANSRGEWVPAIPEPRHLSLGRCRCKCGVTRWSRVSYREHYALVHIVGLAG